ncbi:MAG: hypothetical protein QOD56_1838, partial [Gammaproteobacteria bacterium]|nr:hypothetical protein [Gammaproteobacteria bacterium]
GSMVETLIQGETRTATVLERPAFDPSNSRMKV